MQTKTSKNGSKAAPDLLGTLKRGPGRPKKIVAMPTRTADQIADSLEAQAKGLQHAADILRGKV